MQYSHLRIPKCNLTAKVLWKLRNLISLPQSAIYQFRYCYILCLLATALLDPIDHYNRTPPQRFVQFLATNHLKCLAMLQAHHPQHQSTTY